jgi:hypothetical protein
MTDSELTDLRRWSAGVCGYTEVEDCGEVWYVPQSRGTRHCIRGESWRPDQNIAQAFEVLDALGLEPQMILLKREPTNKWWVTVARHLEPGHGDMEIHESRCIAILLACRKALEAACTS